MVTELESGLSLQEAVTGGAVGCFRGTGNSAVVTQMGSVCDSYLKYITFF